MAAVGNTEELKMHKIARTCTYAVAMTGILFSSGCVVAPDHEHDRGYYDRRADSAEYREHERREAYRRCREEGGHDCDDILHGH
jgi:hypothetical protein